MTLRVDSDEDPQLRKDEASVVHAGRLRLRADLPEGIYPVTVRVHGGRYSVTQNLIVRGTPVHAPPAATDRFTPWLWAGLGIVPVGLTAVAVLAVRRRRRRNSSVA
ncbi:hypothetical protein ABZ769_27040 [Streptomyces olivoreticuli]